MSTFLDDTQKVSCAHDCLPTNASASTKVGWGFLGTKKPPSGWPPQFGPLAGEIAIGRHRSPLFERSGEERTLTFSVSPNG